VHERRPKAPFEREQPLTGALDVVPRIVHPLQGERALDEGHSGDAPHLATLLAGQYATHAGEQQRDAFFGQALCECERVPEYAAERVHGHEDALERSKSVLFQSVLPIHAARYFLSSNRFESTARATRTSARSQSNRRRLCATHVGLAFARL
jgi:hypothetical protein